MREWHVFTKDGEEYISEHIYYITDFVVMYDHAKKKLSVDTRQWSWKKLRMVEVTETWSELNEIERYSIPNSEILKIERWDVS